MKRVLIVEDEILIAMDLKYILEDAGFKVLDTVTNASEAIEVIKTDIPDLVILDVFINGELNGIELAEIIKQNYKIPFYFLTANTEAVMYDKLLMLGPLGVISKPFDEMNIIKQLRISFAEAG